MRRKDKSDYSVGYKKPPRRTQFKPGQSGNSKGRPKKRATFAEVLLKELRKLVTINIGTRAQKVSMLEAIAMKHINKAANGDPKSTALVLNALKPFDSDQGNNIPELLRQFRAIHDSHEATDLVRPPAANTKEVK
jgi:hypothetical protein